MFLSRNRKKNAQFSAPRGWDHCKRPVPPVHLQPTTSVMPDGFPRALTVSFHCSMNDLSSPQPTKETWNRIILVLGITWRKRVWLAFFLWNKIHVLFYARQEQFKQETLSLPSGLLPPLYCALCLHHASTTASRGQKYLLNRREQHSPGINNVTPWIIAFIPSWSCKGSQWPTTLYLQIWMV